MENKKWGHIDLGNQIDNSWNKDTALALKLNGIGFSVKIREEDKKALEKKYIRSLNPKDRKTKRRVVIMIYSFLLYKLLKESGGIVKEVKLCRDINPPNDVYKYLAKICKFYQERPLNEQGFKIRFNNEGKSKAHNLANKTYNGRKKENYLLREKDLSDLSKIISEIIFSIIIKVVKRGQKTHRSVKASSSKTIKAAYESLY